MASGDLGLPGLPAVSHAVQEQDQDQEAAAVLALTVAGKAAQDQAPREKIVTQKHVQVIVYILKA